MQEDILGYLLDSLEPDEQEAIERRIEQDAEFAREVERMRRTLLPLAEDDRIDAPSDLADRTCSLTRYVVQASGRTEWTEARPRMRPIDFAVAAALLFVAATLVFPAIASIRGDQGRIGCANQLREIGVALAMYADQEGGRFPYVAADGPMNNAGIYSVLLKTRDLIDEESTLVCPAADSGMVIVPGLDDYLRAFDDPGRVENLRRYMGGSYGYTLGYQVDGRHDGFVPRDDRQPVVSDRPARASEGRFFNSPNHGDQGQNVLFAGGHVMWIPSRVYGKDDLFRSHDFRIGAGINSSDTVIGVSEATPFSQLEM